MEYSGRPPDRQMRMQDMKYPINDQGFEYGRRYDDVIYYDDMSRGCYGWYSLSIIMVLVW